MEFYYSMIDKIKKNNIDYIHPFLLSKAIRINGLRRRRKVWAFLPPSYFLDSKKRYPVIYFNDGQNIFEGWKATFGVSWEVHNTMKKLSHHEGYRESILIGIEHGKKNRKSEFLPFNTSGAFSSEGNIYTDFIANELKTFVDKNLRTLTGREHTSIIGSSLGGINAFYTGFKHQDVFSKVGVFSPSVWAAPHIFPLIKKVGKHYPTKFYLAVGTQEGKSTLNNTVKLNSALLDSGFDKHEVKLSIIEGARHEELTWQKEFVNYYRWFSEN